MTVADFDPFELDRETRAVRGGHVRSNFGENAEAIFLTSGFVYESAEAAEARFNGEQPGYVYSRSSTAPIRRNGRQRCAPTPSSCFWKRRRTRHWS